MLIKEQYRLEQVVGLAVMSEFKAFIGARI